MCMGIFWMSHHVNLRSVIDAMCPCYCSLYRSRSSQAFSMHVLPT
nr:hypothetical protein Q903MT_gene792 [Picea sitchensis]